jgi:hypothetical protein
MRASSHGSSPSSVIITVATLSRGILMPERTSRRLPLLLRTYFVISAVLLRLKSVLPSHRSVPHDQLGSIYRKSRTLFALNCVGGRVPCGSTSITARNSHAERISRSTWSAISVKRSVETSGRASTCTINTSRSRSLDGQRIIRESFRCQAKLYLDRTAVSYQSFATILYLRLDTGSV